MSEDKKVLLEKVREFEARTGHTVDSFTNDPDNTAAVLKEHRYLREPLNENDAKKQMSARSRRTFLVGGVAALTGILGWRWMSDEAKGALLRRTFEFNEKASQFFYQPTRLAPEFPLTSVSPDRVNGVEGMESEFDPATWNLAVAGLASHSEDLILTLDDIKKLPRTEMTTELKCIEGWSIIVHWAGVRFSDFVTHFAADISMNNLPPYVSLTTPDEKYYVGWDTPSILHPQTLLAYEMNGAPLTPEHGAPLRLASPTKYGIKQIKRIGRIEFTNERPKDFWAEYGYDWYSGH